MISKEEEVQCTSRWKKVGPKSWKGFVYLNQCENDENNTKEPSTYSWYHPYYWMY